MELYQLRHFVAVVETGSFTKGADRAAVSQPALSASIGRLKAELGVKLLDRNRSHVTPTPSGRKLLASATWSAPLEVIRLGWGNLPFGGGSDRTEVSQAPGDRGQAAAG